MEKETPEQIIYHYWLKIIYQILKSGNFLSNVEEIDTRFRDLINWIESLTVPEYTTAQRDALDDPQNGQMIYNSTTTRFEIRQAGGWKYLTVSSV